MIFWKLCNLVVILNSVFISALIYFDCNFIKSVRVMVFNDVILKRHISSLKWIPSKCPSLLDRDRLKLVKVNNRCTMIR